MTRDPELLVVPKRRWQWWRDLAIGLLALTVLLLVLQGRQNQADMMALRDQITRNAVTATEQRATQTAQIRALDAQSDLLNRRLTAAQAENRRLTDLLLDANINPGTPVTDSNGDGDTDLGVIPTPSASPSSATPAPMPTMQVRPTAMTSPSPSAAPTPQPSPTCALSLLGICLVRAGGR